MKFRRNQVFASALCLSLCFGFMTGCGSETASSTSDAASTSSVAAEQTEAVETATVTEDVQSETSEEVSVVEEETEEDLGNPFDVVLPGTDTAELKFSNVYSLPISENGAAVTIMHTALNLMGDLANLGMDSFQDMDYIQELQNRTGVTMDITELPFETAQEQMQITVASGDMPDLLYGLNYSTGDEGALEDEVIMNLSDYEEYAPNYFYMINSNESQKEQFLSDGKVLKFMSPYDQYRCNQGMVIRKDWLEEQGLEVPETYDELTDALQTLKDAYNLDYAAYMNSQCYINGLSDGYNITAFAADGGSDTAMPYYVEDGTVKSTLNADGYHDYLAMLHEWYEAGLIDANFATLEYNPFDNELNANINDGKLAMWPTSGEGIDNYSVEITCLPFPVQEAGDMDHIFDMSLTTDSQNDIYVSSSCEDIELVMNWVDYQYSEDGILFENYGIEGVSYELNENNEPEFTDAVVNNEYGLSVSNMMRIYCGYGVWNAPMLRMRTAEFNSDLANEAWEVWSSKLDGAMTMPDYISLDTEQAQTEGYHSGDILTYAMQMVPEFIMGTSDLDSDWESYCQTLEDMGLDECISVWQDAYDAVNG